MIWWNEQSNATAHIDLPFHGLSTKFRPLAFKLDAFDEPQSNFIRLSIS